MTSIPIHSAELLAWLCASCQQQELPLVISDRATISQVAVLLGVRTPAPSKHPKRHPPIHNAPRIDATTHPMAA